MKLYYGTCTPGEMNWQVYCIEMDTTAGGDPGHMMDSEEMPLNPRFDALKKSLDGFAWGYPGSGPMQLAFAMLANAYYGIEPDPVKFALKWFHHFCTAVLQKLDKDKGFFMDEYTVRALMSTLIDVDNRRRVMAAKRKGIETQQWPNLPPMTKEEEEFHRRKGTIVDEPEKE